MSDWALKHWRREDADKLAAELIALAEPDYLAFHGKLVNTAAPLNGVRQPLIKGFAKQVIHGNWREYLSVSIPVSYEEIMLRGLVIGSAKGDPAEILCWTADFIPRIDNWAVNDYFANALKLAAKHPKQVWEFLQPYLRSEREFELRFAVTMLMNYYINDNYVDRVLFIYDGIRHEGYYVKMAVAWGLSVGYVQYPEKIMAFLRNNHLDDFTYNKAIQKMIESYRVTPLDKAVLRGMKRKAKRNQPTDT